MVWVLTAVRQEVNSFESSVVVHELELAINRALYLRKFGLAVLNSHTDNLRGKWLQWS